MGGCHEIVVCDNLRSGVTRPHRYEPDVNATYQEMAAHYGVAVIPTRTYKPRDKAKVEAGVQLAERWIIARLRHRRFTSLAEANVAIRECVTEINARPFKKMDGSRAELFEQLDRPALRPLPPTRYEFATWRRAKVNIDYHVELDRHYYSVPYQLVGKVVELRCTASVLEVLFTREARRLVAALNGARWLLDRSRAHARVAPPLRGAGHRAASSPGRRRPGPRPRRSSRRSSPHGPIPSRASAPPSGSSASASATAPPASRRRVPGRCICAPTPIAASPRSSSTTSTSSRSPSSLPLPPHPRHRNVRGANYYR